jgi:EAL domain-containing protein (putative c-di-GMP-specific phosphodiesterase class I)
LITVFAILFLVYFILSENYITSSEKNYTNSIKSEIKTFIKSKKADTLAIAQNLAHKKKLIDVMKSDDYKKLYDKNFLKITNEHTDYKHIGYHIIDTKGIQRYISWTDKDIGNSVLKVRKDLAQILKNPHIYSDISVGKFSITFKGVVPIFDEKGKLLGVLEVVSHFNSIAEKLIKNSIYSAVIIDKKFTNHLKYPMTNIFIQGYNIANKDINKNIINLIKKHGMDYYINIDSYEYVRKPDSIADGYYVINIPILNSQSEPIGYFLAFIDDLQHLAKKETAIHLILMILGIVFLLTVYLAYKEHVDGTCLIKNLDEEVKKQIDEKLQIILTDSQTGAYKKTKFNEDIDKFLDSKAVMLNIKNFSKINSTYGFDTGDKILQVCVKRIENILGRKIYRLNADEFIFFSYNTKNEIKIIRQKFINEPIKIEKESVNIRISFSFGVAKTNLDKLISKLSIAVNESKKYPFSDFMYYREKEQDDSFVKFNSILYDAIFSNNDASIVPYFQGIRNNKTKKITKYESLARLKVKDKLYSPYFFLDIAKSSGFIHEITKIMIEKSCAYLSKLDEDFEISINITESDLATRKLKEILLDATYRYGLEPQRITLEVLEGITAVGAKNNIKQLSKLKEAGFKLAIDDFGVEYSNFERLNELDIDFIKIDGKYIKSIHENQKSYKITKAITDFAHSLDISVVAEFVENEEIQKEVETLGIECSQGYYFSKPQENIEV